MNGFSTRLAYLFDRAVMDSLMPLKYGLGYDFPARQVSLVDPAFYMNSEFVSEPASFYRGPDGIPDVQSAMLEETLKERTWALSFKSSYQPLNPAFGPQYDSYFENHTAYARLHEAKNRKNAPVIINLHGWTNKSFQDAERSQKGDAFADAGIDIITWAQPYHMQRTPGECLFSGEYYLSGDIPRTAEAVAQNVYDLRSLISWLIEQGHETIGIIGRSLGGYMALMMAATEPRLDFVIALMPLGNLPRMLYQGKGGLTAVIRKGFSAAGVSYQDVCRAWAPISPHSLKPVIPKERVLIAAGLGDAYVPRDSTLEVWEAWDHPNIVWYPGGHLSIMLPGNQRIISRATAQFIQPLAKDVT